MHTLLWASLGLLAAVVLLGLVFLEALCTAPRGPGGDCE